MGDLVTARLPRKSKHAARAQSASLSPVVACGSHADPIQNISERPKVKNVRRPYSRRIISSSEKSADEATCWACSKQALPGKQLCDSCLKDAARDSVVDAQKVKR